MPYLNRDRLLCVRGCLRDSCRYLDTGLVEYTYMLVPNCVPRSPLMSNDPSDLMCCHFPPQLNRIVFFCSPFKVYILQCSNDIFCNVQMVYSAIFTWCILQRSKCIQFCSVQMIYSAMFKWCILQRSKCIFYNEQRIYSVMFKMYILEHSTCIFWNVQMVYSAISKVYIQQYMKTIILFCNV